MQHPHFTLVARLKSKIDAIVMVGKQTLMSLVRNICTVVCISNVSSTMRRDKMIKSCATTSLTRVRRFDRYADFFSAYKGLQQPVPSSLQS